MANKVYQVIEKHFINVNGYDVLCASSPFDEGKVFKSKSKMYIHLLSVLAKHELNNFEKMLMDDGSLCYAQQNYYYGIRVVIHIREIDLV